MSPRNASSPAASAAPPEDGGSQSVKVQQRLREMILAGELQAGGRITEVAMAERLGVSRTPVRSALVLLEQEGLLQKYPSGGYALRTFTEADVWEAIELRGVIEGLAVRLAAERGAPAPVLEQAHAHLDAIDQLLFGQVLDDFAFSRYVALNHEFHDLFGQLCASAVMQRELERVRKLPFASPSGFVKVQADTPQARDMLVVAQDQHRQVIDAIGRREGSRAEAIMREHARLAQRNLRDALRGTRDVPGVGLIHSPP